MRLRRCSFSSLPRTGGALALFLLGCGEPKLPDAPTASPSPPDGGTVRARTSELIPLDAGATEVLAREEEAEEEPTRPAAEGAPCPAAMVLVDTEYCPKIERKCLDEEYSPQNKIYICHKFASSQHCLVPTEHRRFCIDTYEYPNRAGAHPPRMVSWYDAQSTCSSLEKRLCWESEWVAACEGPRHTPFPYGYDRDSSKCNIDNYWIEPRLKEMYSRDPEVSSKELDRLDQSVASGQMDECQSGFGVHDMTGNFDEWITADRYQEDKSEWAGLKGGAWGHVRNACRPMTTSHPPDFTYYFISFRCCADAADSEVYVPPHPPEIPRTPAIDKAPIPEPIAPPGPSSSKVPRQNGPQNKRPSKGP